MVDRATRIRLIDGAFLVGLVALGVTAHRFIANPSIPDDVCVATTDDGPRYGELLADGRITIAAVFAEIKDDGAYDPNARSARALADALRARGFTETAPRHFEAGEIAVDISPLLPHDAEVTGRALTEAFATHELVYYNGHSDHGEIAFTTPPDDYRIALLDTCYSTQLFSSRLLGPERDVISNTNRSVTGSTVSLLVVIDALRARATAWQPLLDDMNARADERARLRAGISRYREPERYRLDARCSS
jgi:hypothetical protein